MRPFRTLSGDILIIILAGALLWGCAATSNPKKAGGPKGVADPSSGDLSGFGPDAPDWARTGTLPRYPSDRFITGLGYSPPDAPEVDAHSLAKAQAFKDIADQVETQISNEFTSIQRSVFHNADLDELVDVKSVTKQVTKELLAGAEVVQRYYDPGSGTAAALAVMDRLKLSERLLKEAGDERTKLDGFMTGYGREAAQGDPAPMIKSLVHADAALQRIAGAHLKAIAVGVTKQMSDRFEALNDPELAARITREFGALKDRVRIRIVEGNEQRAMLTGLLKEPVKVQALFTNTDGSTPLANFPMHVVVEDPSLAAVVPGSNTTDAEGYFTFSLQELKATGSASNTVSAALDFKGVEKRSTLAEPHAKVVYLMPTRETTRIGVLVHETIDGRENKNPYISSALKEALTDIGFQVIRLDAGGPLSEVVGLPPAALTKKYGAQCEYLIVGTAESEASSRTGAFIFYRARLVIDALELESGKTIHFEVPFEKTKSGQGTEEKAMRASFAKAANILVGDAKQGTTGLLAEKFIARFEEGGEWKE